MARPKNGNRKDKFTWYAEIELLDQIEELRRSRFPVPDATAIVSELVDLALNGLAGRCKKSNSNPDS